MSKVYTIAPWGLQGLLVEVEANLSRHLPKIIVVGLPDASVQEAKERVWAAIENSGLDFPRQKVVINLAPAQIRKEGGSYDLPMAISVLVASGILPEAGEKSAFIGELSLSGELKAVPGALVMVSSLADLGFREVFLPRGNAKESAIVKGIDVYPASSLSEVVDHLLSRQSITPLSRIDFVPGQNKSMVDLAWVKGQSVAKRVLEIAAAGGHNLLMVGPPGAGKTMLAKSFLSILPDLTLKESLAVSKIHSLAGLLSEERHLVDIRLMRSPHHSASVSAIVGGGSWPKPGEISLAHNNVLFLDEILEFPRRVLEALRQPLEDKIITVSRIRGSLDFPANFILLATSNPCPCGYLGDKTKECKCTALDIERYQKRLSGPLLDRIDLHLKVEKVASSSLTLLDNHQENSQTVKIRVAQARNIQVRRFQNCAYSLNADIETLAIKKFCPLEPSGQKILGQAIERLGLSARGYFKVIKVARTIADLAGSQVIGDRHILEALQYRRRILGD